MRFLNLQIGAWKAIGERALNYFGKLVTFINFLLLINVSTILGTNMAIYIPAGIVLFVFGILFMIFDIMVILPQENFFIFKNNPEIQEIKRDIKELKERLTK